MAEGPNDPDDRPNTDTTNIPMNAQHTTGPARLAAGRLAGLVMLAVALAGSQGCCCFECIEHCVAPLKIIPPKSALEPRNPPCGYVDPSCYGYHFTCWRAWPAECTAANDCDQWYQHDLLGPKDMQPVPAAPIPMAPNPAVEPETPQPAPPANSESLRSLPQPAEAEALFEPAGIQIREVPEVAPEVSQAAPIVTPEEAFAQRTSAQFEVPEETAEAEAESPQTVQSEPEVVEEPAEAAEPAAEEPADVVEPAAEQPTEVIEAPADIEPVAVSSGPAPVVEQPLVRKKLVR